MTQIARQHQYRAVAGVYDAFLTLTGFKHGVERFLDRLAFTLPAKPRLLDAGCGTGLMSTYLSRRYPDAEITAFDIDREMLSAMEKVLKREATEKVTAAFGDLVKPGELRSFPHETPFTIPEASLDGIFVSGALEHVPLQESITALSRLLKPGGIFFNLGIRRNPAGAVLAMVYRFRPYRIAEFREACAGAGLADIRAIRLSTEDFPANLSRIAVIAKKA